MAILYFCCQIFLPFGQLTYLEGTHNRVSIYEILKLFSCLEEDMSVNFPLNNKCKLFYTDNPF